MRNMLHFVRSVTHALCAAQPPRAWAPRDGRRGSEKYLSLRWSAHHAQRTTQSEGRQEKTNHDAERKEGGEAVQEGVQTRAIDLGGQGDDHSPPPAQSR